MSGCGCGGGAERPTKPTTHALTHSLTHSQSLTHPLTAFGLTTYLTLALSAFGARRQTLPSAKRSTQKANFSGVYRYTGGPYIQAYMDPDIALTRTVHPPGSVMYAYRTDTVRHEMEIVSLLLLAGGRVVPSCLPLPCSAAHSAGWLSGCSQCVGVGGSGRVRACVRACVMATHVLTRQRLTD